MVVAQTVKLNEASIRTYHYDEQTQEIDGAPRRVWTFDLLAIGQEDKENLNRLLQDKDLTLTIADEKTRVRKGTYSYSYEGPCESPTTRYHYDIELVELLEGEEPPDTGWGFLGQIIVDVAKAISILSLEQYEQRLRQIEEHLRIDNREHIEAYERRIDGQLDGWLKRWPEKARDLGEISQTPKIKELLASLPPEDPGESNGME